MAYDATGTQPDSRSRSEHSRMVPRAIPCQTRGYLAPRVATVMEAATVAARHLTAGCPADAVQIHLLAWGR